jgi:ribosomal protein S18 acetylase RimI-like enzyme
MSARPDPLVRLAGKADLAAVGRLLHDFNTEFTEPTPGAAALAERVGRLLDEGQTSVMLAEVGPGGADGPERTGEPDGPDRPAGPHGLAVLRFRPAIWSPGLECYLAELYVVPRMRGRGIGRAIMQASMDHARDRGADHMDLGTGEQDVAARALYESLGFSNREGRPDGPINYFYEREL